MRCRCLLLVLCALDLAAAAVLRVAPGQPLQPVIDQARAGDTVLLSAGVHRARVRCGADGEWRRPLTLAGEPGAVLDGSEEVRPAWQPAPDVADGVWRTKLPFTPFTVTVNGKVLCLLNEQRVDPDQVKDPAWGWPRLFRDGVGKTGWVGVKGLGMWRAKEQALWIKLPNEGDPRQLRFTFAPRAPIVHVTGHRWVVRDLRLQNGAYGVQVEDALGAVVEHCAIGPVDFGVWLGPGSQQCTVRFCELFWNPYAGADPNQPGAWDHWLAHKDGGFHDRCGIEMRATRGGHQIHDNSIHDHWDGIEDTGTFGENPGLRVEHNRIHNVCDDGLEPNGEERDCRWNDNLVIRSICGFRIKAPLAGPLYAFRNVFFENHEDYRNFGAVELQPATVYIYQNTCTAPPAITSNKVKGIGTPRYHYYNNLFWCRTWWSGSSSSIHPNWQGDYNVFARSEDTRGWDKGVALAKQLGLDQHSLFTTADPGFQDASQHDIRLRADSPARGRGADLAKLLGVALPGLTPGEGPDCGAVQFGAPLPQPPRPADTVQVAPAGTWPGREAKPAAPVVQGPNHLAGGSFEAGLDGWQVDPHSGAEVVTGDAQEGGHYLRLKVAGGTGAVQRPITGLVKGRAYVLVYWSRRSNFGDCRVIVRDLGNAGYLAVGGLAGGPSWRPMERRFVATAETARLELSPRTDGVGEIDAMGVYEAER